MLVEAIEFFLTPTTKIAKKYGFLHQSIALKHRFERCKTFWQPHLLECQKLFAEVVHTLPQRNKVVVLGSAHLHEIPLHLLLENFKEIFLVDVVHPYKHHRTAKKNPRLKLITQDVGGILDNLHNFKNLEELSSKVESLKSETLFSYEADLIISGNLMSQLALLPLDYVEHKMKRKLTLEEKDIICTAAAELHLQNLKKCKGEILIYADREVLYRDQGNEIIYQGSYPVNFAGFEKLKEWIWLIAPLKEASKDFSIEMKVEAFHRSK